MSAEGKSPEEVRRQKQTDLDQLAAEADLVLAEVRADAKTGDAEMVAEAARRAGIPISQVNPSKSPSSLRLLGWAAALAAGLLLTWNLWPASQTPNGDGPRTYLTAEWIVGPIGVVDSFEVFSINADFSERLQVNYLVYDATGSREIARADDQGSEWRPTKEQREAMREAGEIQWVVRLVDPLGAPREGRASATLAPTGSSGR